MRLIKTLTAAAVALALMLVPAGALAKSRDRNHDHIPDKWEKAHHLSLRVNEARRDQDHDGLNNLAEFRDGTNPRAADTDGDGINDGTEVEDGSNPDNADDISGTVVSFENNVLTIQLPGTDGKTVSGTVNDQTRIECSDDGAENSGSPTDAQASSDGGDDSEPVDGQDGSSTCTTANLVPGAQIHEAKTETAGDGSTVFTKIELVPPAPTA